MAEFQNFVNSWQWGTNEVYITIYYETSYDPISNTTTVTFSDSTVHRMFSDANTDCSAHTTITVTATDSGNQATAIADGAGHPMSMGYVLDWCLPDPHSITVKHANTAGSKSITISAHSTFYFFYGYNTSASGSTSIDVSSGTFTAYQLSTSAGDGSLITVDRTSSAAGGNIGNLSNGASIYKNDVLQITFGANPGYKLKTHTVNGSTFASGGTHTVSSNVTIIAVAELHGLVYIYNGTSWDAYQVYIDNGASWDQYIPYVDNGTNWDMCS